MARSRSIGSLAAVVAPRALAAALALAATLALAILVTFVRLLTPVGAFSPVLRAVADAAVAAPTDLTVARLKPDVVLRWNHPGGEIAGFEIERSTTPGRFDRIGKAAGDARTFRDRESRPGMAYTYRVRAIAPGAASEYSKEAIVIVGGSQRR